MVLITFMSDFGMEDHYVAAVKARIITLNPDAKIIDIGHHIEPFSLSHGAHVLKSVFRDFPQGTIHLAAVDTFTKNWSALAMKLEEHFFIGPDNGLLSLISAQKPVSVVDLTKLNPAESTFPARDIYAQAAAHLSNGKRLKDLGPPLKDWTQLLDRQIKTTKTLVSGNIIRVDNYGNLITNIPRSEFENLVSINQSSRFEINLGREQVTKIHKSYHSVEPGDCFCIFNSLGLLEVGINSGNASELLGLNFDNPISIHFKPE